MYTHTLGGYTPPGPHGLRKGAHRPAAAALAADHHTHHRHATHTHTHTHTHTSPPSSHHAAQGFKNMVPKKARVLRDGVPTILDVAELVPGGAVCVCVCVTVCVCMGASSDGVPTMMDVADLVPGGAVWVGGRAHARAHTRVCVVVPDAGA